LRRIFSADPIDDEKAIRIGLISVDLAGWSIARSIVDLVRNTSKYGATHLVTHSATVELISLRIVHFSHSPHSPIVFVGILLLFRFDLIII